MKNKILILYSNSNYHSSIKTKDIKKLKKNFTKVISYNESFGKEFTFNVFNEKKLNQIYKSYKIKNIKLKLEKIYSVNFFLKKIKNKFKDNKIYISTFILNNYVEEDIIFYELSKIYKMQYLKPERSFIKNRYILSKNLYKQYYEIKTQIKISYKEIKTFKINYIAAMDNYRKWVLKRNINLSFNFINKILLYVLSLIFQFKINKQPKKYALMVLGNSLKLNALAGGMELKIFVNKFLKNFDYQLVFLIHPNTNSLKYLMWHIKNNKIFFNNNRVTIMQKPKRLDKIIDESEFVVHLNSSASAQALIFNKKILCIGKNFIYLSYLNNVITNINNKLYSLKKKVNRNDILKLDKYLINLLSNSVNSKGEFKLSTSKSYYSSNFVSYKKIYGKKIVTNLLNSI